MRKKTYRNEERGLQEQRKETYGDKGKGHTGTRNDTYRNEERDLREQGKETVGD